MARAKEGKKKRREGREKGIISRVGCRRGNSKAWGSEFGQDGRPGQESRTGKGENEDQRGNSKQRKIPDVDWSDQVAVSE